MNNVLLWIGGLLVALLCTLFAVPHFVDWTSYRGVFEEEASRVLGREVRVAGAVNLRLLPTPYVRFEKVRLSDAAGQTGEPFFRADDFTLWLAPGPLLRGAIEAREIELRKPTLKLRLNAQGGGNWQTLSIVKGSLPFVPSDVALQSVLITDGTVSIDGADGRELMRAGAVTGELSVTALEGPFRFKGAVEWAGVRHDLKLSTTAFEADGGLKMKAQVAVPSTSNSYVFDGRIGELSGKVNVAGQITGQLAFVPSQLGRLLSDVPAAAAGARRVPVDLRAAITADSASASLTDISLAFENDGKPQLVAGTAQVDWRDGLAVKSEFQARWIDLDQLLADKGGVSKPLDAVRRLASALPHLLPVNGRGQASLKIDQVTLGAEALSDVKLQVERDATALRLADFRVNLPGGTRANLSGALPGGDAFDGDISLRGANLARLIGWLGYAATVAEARAEGAFSLKSKFAFNQQSIAVNEAFASLGNAVLTGGVAYKWSDRPRLDIVLDGDQIDLGLVSPRALDLLAHARSFTSSQAGSTATTPAAASAPAAPMRHAFDPRAQDTTLRIRAGRLLDAERDLRDVDVDAAFINGKLNLKRLRFFSGAGLEIDAEGDIAEVGTRPRGSLRGTIGVADEVAIAELLELFDQPQDGDAFQRL
ncbi:MAG: AsmA family protein, partial [Hyphomicrobiaceae bacterium]